MRRLAIVIGILLMATAAAAQTATPSKSLAWDQPDATLTEALAYTYTHYDDAGLTGVALTGVTCVTGVPVTCSAPFPAFTPGAHTVAITATNEAGESLPSTPLPFTFVIIPSAPVNLRIAELDVIEETGV